MNRQAEASSPGRALKIGIALGGGGARGAAHLGVLEELTQLGIQPDLITGTSIGGLIGALLATGMKLEKIKQFFAGLTLGKLYALPENTLSLTGNQKIERLLEATIGRPTFEQLKIPLALVATDLVRQVEVVLDEGDLISAVLATIALPVLLPPVERQGLLLVDGGLLNNTPFDVARSRGATFVVGIDLMNAAPYGSHSPSRIKPGGLLDRVFEFTQRHRSWQVAGTVIDIITNHSLKIRSAVSPPDVLIRPFMGSIDLLDFHRWEEAYQAGRKAARAKMPEIQVLLQKGRPVRSAPGTFSQ